MYSGQIQSTGPRYCPSIEDKVVRFADREQHQIFLEPEGRNTLEYYCNGISTSLPRDVQEAIIPLIPGLEHAEIMRFGYAVEYDFAPPTQLRPTLETKPVARPLLRRPDQRHDRLRGGGRPGPDRRASTPPSRSRSEPPLVLDRSQAYIGVLIDDLVTRGVDEPYRMFTSRAEYRLAAPARQRRPPAHRAGPPGRPGRRPPLGAVRGPPRRRSTRLRDRPDDDPGRGRHARPGPAPPETTWDELRRALTRTSATLTTLPDVIEQVTIEAKYDGYIGRQAEQVERFRRLEDKPIPADLDYAAIPQLRAEAREKFERVRPRSLGQAGRISGISPADIATLLVHLKRKAPTRTASGPRNAIKGSAHRKRATPAACSSTPDLSLTLLSWVMPKRCHSSPSLGKTCFPAEIAS